MSKIWGVDFKGRFEVVANHEEEAEDLIQEIIEKLDQTIYELALQGYADIENVEFVETTDKRKDNDFIEMEIE